MTPVTKPLPGCSSICTMDLHFICLLFCASLLPLAQTSATCNVINPLQLFLAIGNSSCSVVVLMKPIFLGHALPLGQPLPLMENKTISGGFHAGRTMIDVGFMLTIGPRKRAHYKPGTSSLTSISQLASIPQGKNVHLIFHRYAVAQACLLGDML